MAKTRAPRVKLEVAWTSDPEAASPAWSDESDYLTVDAEEFGLVINRGRDHPLEPFAPGTMVAMLRDPLRRFDPLNTSSPLYPNVLPERRCRVTVEYPWLGWLAAVGISDSFEPNALGSLSTTVAPTGWAIDAGNGNLGTSTAQAFKGTSSLLRTKGAGSGDMSAVSLPVPVVAGDPVTVTARALRGAGASNRSVSVRLQWFNNLAGSGSPASTTTGADVTEGGASTWVRPTASATVPAGALTMRVVLYVKSAAANELHHFDAIAADNVAAIVEEVRFTGYTEEPEPIVADFGRRYCRLRASDWLRVAAEEAMPESSPWAEFVRTFAPQHWWRMGEWANRNGTRRIEDEGAATDRPLGLASSAALSRVGSAGPSLVFGDENPSMTFAGAEGLEPIGGDAEPTARPFTIILFVRTDWTAEAGTDEDSSTEGPGMIWWQAPDTYIFYEQGAAGAAGRWGVYIGGTLAACANVDLRGPSPHALVVEAVTGTNIRLWTHGVETDTTTGLPPAPTTYGGIYQVPFIGTPPSGEPGLGFRGEIDEVAWWNLDMGDLMAFFTAYTGLGANAGDDFDTRLNGLIGAGDAAHPTATVDTTGTVTFGPEVWAGRKKLAVIAEHIAAEDGAFYAKRDGTLRARARTALASAPYTTVQATFGPGAGELPYTGAEFASPTSLLVNTATITRRGGSPQISTDATSVGKFHAKAEVRSDMPFDADADALTLAARLVTRFKDPRDRVAAITCDLRADSGLPAAILARELEDRVRVKTSALAGSAINQTANVQRFTERYGRLTTLVTLGLFPTLD